MNKKLLVIGLLAGVIVFGSCKPKQSAYKSVYEAAQEKQMEEAQEEASSMTPPPANINPAPTSEESIRKEKVTPVYDADAPGLRSYNVVIAAMSMKPNAESLKQRMEREGYNIILVQNEQGMYRVIIASSDSKDEAVARKNEILSEFAAKGTPESLRAKFGIPFNDWWILERAY